MTNTLQTNTFTGGMNLDVDITMIPDNQYRYAENVRVITDTAGTTGVLQNVQDVKTVEDGDFMSSNETVLATTTIDKYGVILTVDDNNICRIYRVENYNNLPLTYEVVVKGNLGYTSDSQVKIIANYESYDNIKIYLSAPNTVIKVLNIVDSKYTQGIVQNPLLDTDGNIKDASMLDIQVNALLKIPEITSLGTGSLPTGIVQYAYQLFNVRGSSTSYSPVSSAIHLTDSDVSQGAKNYMGNNKNVNSGKSVNVRISLSNIPTGLFDNIRLIRIHYDDFSSTPTISVCQESSLTNSSSYFNFTDIGGVINTLTQEEFNRIQEGVFTASTIETKDNILFAANVKESTWKPEYDARAYRFTKKHILLLNNSDGSRIRKTITTDNISELGSIPKDHDCINPYNQSDYDFGEDTSGGISDGSLDPSKYQIDGTTLGGTGLNIEYNFVTTEIDLDNNFCDSLTIDGFSTTQSRIQVTNVSDSTDSNYIYFNDEAYINYADPYFASKYKGYHRDEIYRFGIVFFNEKNVATPVYWIGDIKFPHCWEDCPWYVGDNKLVGYAIGLKFTVKNYPEGTKAYQIVRCKRNKEDRTILTQALVSGTVSYPYHSVKNGEYDIAGDTTRRPFTFLGNTWQKNGVGPSESFTSYRWMLADKLDNNVSTLISPEIDLNQDDIAKQIKGCKADLCLKLDPRTNKKSDNYYGYYIKTDRTQKVEGGIQVTNNYQTQGTYVGSLLGGTTDNTNTFIIANNQQDQNITNLIGKRYIAHYTGFGNTRGTFDITDSISPVILQKFDWSNVASLHSPIDGKLYLNSPVSQCQEQCSDKSFNKTGYFGNCIVIAKSNNNITVPQELKLGVPTDNSPRPPQVSGTIATLISEKGYTQFTTPIVNIKTSNNPYGGNTYSARSNSTYISTYSYHKIATGETQSQVFVFGGDTYLGILDHKTVTYMPQYVGGTETPDVDCGIAVSDYIPFETSINLALMYGSSASRTCSSGLDYVDPYLALTIDGASYGGHTQSKPYYAYNDAYSRQPDAQQYAADSNYSISNLQSGNRIRYSGTKTANEINDSWTQFKVADYLDVDSSHGDITNLKKFNNQLMFWQKDAVGIAAVNDRSLITDNNQSPLVLGTGGVLSRYDYLTTSNGTDKPNDKSIIDTPNGLYWYDDSKNEICSYGNGIQKLSKVKSVQSWLNTDTRKSKVSLYDPKFNEVQMGFDDKVLVYDEQIGQFSSFRTYNPDNYLSFPDKLLYIKDQLIQENADFPLSTIKSKLQIIVNKDPLLTKTFDNVFFSGEFDNIQEMMSDIKFTTKTQQGSIFKDSTEVDNPIEQREDTYRFAVGRENNSEDTMSLPSRMKGKYMICDYLIDCSNNHNFRLPSINTTYRYSMV